MFIEMTCPPPPYLYIQDTGEPVIRGLVIVPTKELSSQATKNLKVSHYHCTIT